MKKGIFFLVVLVALNSCKNESKTDTIPAEDSKTTVDQSDKLILLKGEFIYYGDAAVLQTHKEIYAVTINEKMHELNEQVQRYKTQVTDMIPVELKGLITPKPDTEEGWPFRVEIKEILNVSKPNPEGKEIITLGKE